MKISPLLEDLPIKKNDRDQKIARKEMFHAFDPNGNGYLSLAEVDLGLVQSGKKLPKPVILRAFKAACRISQDHGKNLTDAGESYIEFPEFRMFLIYLRKYTLLWEVFCALDTGNDRRIDLKEFKKGIKKLQALDAEIDMGHPDEEFEKIDTDHGGQILFEEFGDWGVDKVYTSLK